MAKSDTNVNKSGKLDLNATIGNIILLVRILHNTTF